MKKSSDLMPEFKANLPKSSHVLSHDLGMTATVAHLNPVFHTIMNPGEKIRLGFDFQLRTMPLESAAFADLTCHTEYFFVPMTLLYQPFSSVYYGVNDQFSSAFGSLGQALSNANSFPLLDFDKLYHELNDDRTRSVFEGVLGFESLGQSSIRLFDLLGYNPKSIATSVTDGDTGNYQPNVFPYALLAYNCIYQYYYRLDTREQFAPSTFNWDRFATKLNDATLIEDIGFWPHMHYRPMPNDYFTDVKISPIVDVLNLSDKTKLSVTNDWLSRNNLVGNSILSSGSEGNSSSSEVYDFPTSVGLRNPSNAIQTQFGFSSVVFGPNSAPSGVDITTANIRALFANEKLWSITGRARKNYDDQTLAHFGVKVPHDVKHEITCFGHDVAKIHIGEVISTSNTATEAGGSPLGEIAGKGYGQQSNSRHEFVAPCHGVVMAIFSVVPTRNYETLFNKYNAVTNKFDLYIPEYDHLGMQPIFGYEANAVEVSKDTPELVSKILGWQYRYEQWKRRFNRVTGAFHSSDYGGSLRSWIPSYDPNRVYSNTPNDSSSFIDFIYKPTDINQIMLGQYPSTWSESFETAWQRIYDFDPFVINSHIDAILLSTMSDYSLPRLDA